MISPVSGKFTGPEFEPYWAVNPQSRKLLPQSSTLPYSVFLSGRNSEETPESLYLSRPSQDFPLERVALLKDTRVAKKDILNLAWELYQRVVATGTLDNKKFKNSEAREKAQEKLEKRVSFLQEKLFAPWSELKHIAQSEESEFSSDAQDILDLRRAIHTLKVNALKRSAGPAWAEAQIQNLASMDPNFGMFFLPIYHSAYPDPSDSIAKIQDHAFQKGYLLFYGPYPKDPLLGRPEFLAMAWARDPRYRERLRPQWGVLSEDGYFNTRRSALRKITKALGLYTLPHKVSFEGMRHYARMIHRIKAIQHGEQEGDIHEEIGKAQKFGRELGLSMNPLIFNSWIRASQGSPETPLFPPKISSRPVPLLLPDETTHRWLDCFFPLWTGKNYKDTTCLALSDQSGRPGIFDGFDQWGYLDEKGEVQSDEAMIRGALNVWGLKTIPKGIPFEAMDRYARHFNRAYKISSADELGYPSASLYQVLSDLEEAFRIAEKYRLPIKMDRYHRVTQDALYSFWRTAPELFEFNYVSHQVDEEKDVGMLFYGFQDVIDRERRGLEVAATLLNRDPVILLGRFDQMGLEMLEKRLNNDSPKNAYHAQYTLRLLLSYQEPKALKNLIPRFEKLARESAELGEEDTTLKWLNSRSILRQGLGYVVPDKFYQDTKNRAETLQGAKQEFGDEVQPDASLITDEIPDVLP